MTKGEVIPTTYVGDSVLVRMPTLKIQMGPVIETINIINVKTPLWLMDTEYGAVCSMVIMIHCILNQITSFKLDCDINHN